MEKDRGEKEGKDKDMENYLKKIKPKYYWMIAFVLTAITYTMTFSYMGMLSNGKYIIARSDLRQQYIPFIEYFCSVLRGEHDYWFSWALNLGTGTSLLFAYYTLSPFNLIYLILGEDLALTATALVIVLKAATAAATFQIFISKYLKKTYYETVLFAMMYALCGFQVCYYFDLMWMDAFYMLPVIAIGIIKLIRERKCMCLLFAYTYVFAVNFYMGYIVGWSSFFLFLFYYLYSGKERNVKNNIKIALKYGVCVIDAILLTAIIWFPAIKQLYENRVEGYPEFSLGNCNFLFLYNNLFMGQMQTLNGITPFIYCGLLSMLLLPFFLINKRIRLKKRIYVFLCLLWFCCLFLIEPLNKAMHAFDRPEMFCHRFSFVFSFIITTICCEQILYIRQISKKKLYIVLVSYLCLFVASRILYSVVWQDDYNANTWMVFVINSIFFIAWFFGLRKIQKKGWNTVTYRVVMTFLLMLELGCNAVFCMNRMEHKVMKQETYEAWNNCEKATFEKIKSKEDEKFYRILYLNPRGQNQAFLYDYNSVENFNSAEHATVLNAIEKLGFYRGVHMMKGAGSTPITCSLLNIKYIISGIAVESELNSDEFYLAYQKNDNVLSLGFMVKSDIKNYAFVDSPFDNQDNLLCAMTGEDIQCFERIGMQMDIVSGVYAKDDNATYLLHEDDIKGEARFDFEAENDGRPLYVYFQQDRYVDATNGASIPSIETNDITSTLENMIVNPQLVPARIIQIGTDEENKYKFSVVLPENLEADYYNKAFFCYYDECEFLRAYELLKRNQLKVTECEDGYVKGIIEVENDGIMFTSIPYDSGWTVMVDGKNVETVPLIDNAFLGVELEKGKHDVEMNFEPSGKKEGITISSIALMITLTACAIFNLLRHLKN